MKKPPILGDEDFIQIFTVEQKRQGVPDKYNFPEAIAGNVHYHRVLATKQRDADTSYYERRIKKLQKKIHTTNVYYLKEIQRIASELKQADKNYLELKNNFDELVEEVQYSAWQTGIKWVGVTFAKNMTLKEIMDSDFWKGAIKPRGNEVASDIEL